MASSGGMKLRNEAFVWRADISIPLWQMLTSIEEKILIAIQAGRTAAISMCIL